MDYALGTTKYNFETRQYKLVKMQPITEATFNDLVRAKAILNKSASIVYIENTLILED